jgi:hypothetical protein
LARRRKMRGQVLSGTNLSECRSLYYSIHQQDFFWWIFLFWEEGCFTIVIFEGYKRRRG